MKIKYNQHLLFEYKHEKKEQYGIFFLMTYNSVQYDKHSCPNYKLLNIYELNLYLKLTNKTDEYLRIINRLEKIAIINNGKKPFLFEKSINDYPGLYSLFKKYQKYYLNILIK